MKIAEVLLPLDNDSGFDYLIPDALLDSVKSGSLVSVDFRKRRMTGIVLKVKDSTDVKRLKEVEESSFEAPLDANFLKFVCWAADYYFATKGVVFRQFSLSDVDLKRRFVCTSKMSEHLELYVSSREKPLTKGEALKILKSEESFNDLLKRGVIAEDIIPFVEGKRREVTLNEEQESSFERVNDFAMRGEHKGFLLYGQPSTGKTEVYFKLIHELMDKTDKSVLLLFPEIGLADIFFRRISEEFGSLVAAKVHSELTEGESNCYFRKIMDGGKRIVVGTRSAVFAPVKNLGLVIIDEEQDQSYKQFDASPFYNGRDCGVYRAYLSSAPVLLVSATPSAESYANVKSGKYELLKLEKRYLDTPKPEVRIIYNISTHKSIAPLTVTEVSNALSGGRQVLIFLNRRGYLNLYKCSKCGEYFKCDNCSVSYSFHKSQREFVCHYCGSVKRSDAECPICGGKIVSSGVWGTEMVESVFSKLFPGAVIERFDTDSTRRKGERKRIIERVISREAHILVGTQMVSKGYDIPDIHTAVILNADSVINIPDIRSEERFMQMLVQTAGRAGRRAERGVILVELGESGIHLKDFIENLDYPRFMEEEILRRKNHSFPPFARMLRIIHRNKDREATMMNLHKIYTILSEAKKKNVRVMPPGFNYVERVNGLYRGEMFVVYSSLNEMKSLMKKTEGIGFEYQIDNDTL